MVTASLREFLSIGCLGELKCGMDQSDVTRLIGEPDDTMEHPITFHAFYGCVNIQFSSRKKIAVLFVQVEDPVFPNAGPSIDIDPWQIEKGMTLPALADVLIKESISFYDRPTQIEIRLNESRLLIWAMSDAETPEPHPLLYLSATDLDELSYC